MKFLNLNGNKEIGAKLTTNAKGNVYLTLFRPYLSPEQIST
jgi:hypothetical protein